MICPLHRTSSHKNALKTVHRCTFYRAVKTSLKTHHLCRVMGRFLLFIPHLSIEGCHRGSVGFERNWRVPSGAGWAVFERSPHESSPLWRLEAERKTPRALKIKRPEKSRKSLFWFQGLEEDRRRIDQVQNMSKAIKAVIPMNPIKKAMKFVVAR